jgi:hypothetical protein
LQLIGGGNDQRKPVVTRKVDIFAATLFPSFSTQSTHNGRSLQSTTTTGDARSGHPG